MKEFEDGDQDIPESRFFSNGEEMEYIGYSVTSQAHIFQSIDSGRFTDSESEHILTEGGVFDIWYGCRGEQGGIVGLTRDIEDAKVTARVLNIDAYIVGLRKIEK